MLIFLKILFILFCLLLGLILVILLTPIYLSFKSNGEKTENALIVIHFFNPAFIRISYYFSGNKIKIVILNVLSFGTLKKKSEPDFVKKDVKPDKEESTAAEEFSEAEHSFKEHVSDDYPKDSTFSETEGRFDTKRIDPDLQKEQEDIENKKDIKSGSEKALRSNFLTESKKNILAFKEFSQFVLDQKKIARRVVSWLKRIIGTLIGVVRFDDLSLYLKAGFDNPYHTGIVYGFFTGIKNLLELKNCSSNGLQFEPVFIKNDSVAVGGSIRIKTSLVRICLPVFVAIFTFPYISAFILWRRMKRRKKLFQSKL